MKSLDEYLAIDYEMQIIEDLDEGGYVASFPSLPGCLATGDTIDEAK